MLQVVIGIVTLAVIIYIGVLIYQRTVARRVVALREKLTALQELPLQNELDAATQLSLTGKSLDQFEDVKTHYAEITTQAFPLIEEQLSTIQEEAKGLNLIKTRSDFADAKDLVNDTDTQVHGVQAALAELQEVDKQHREAVTELEKRYQELRKTLLARNFSFGPSIDKLEEMLSDLENSFNDFSRLTSEGDHEAAEDILLALKADTEHLDQLIDQIPDIYKDLATEFPAQLEEVRGGYQSLSDEHYNFGETDIPAEADTIDLMVKDNLTALTDLRTETAAANNQTIAEKIDHLYDVMQVELDARKPVEAQVEGLSKLITRVQNQNHSLGNELDRLSQNYTLDHQEVETARELSEQLKAIDATYQADIQAITDKTAVYSTILAHQTEQLTALEQIATQQTEIHEAVAGLVDEERKARETLQRFDFQMHAMKRGLENLKLPGLPQDYLDYFFVVSDEIEKLDASMNQVKINMEEITKQLIMIQSDLDTLRDKTTDITDSAMLSEQLLQYANRYRASHPDVETASQRAQQLFDKDFDYAGSLETIATVLDVVEPGSYKRLEDSYYAGKNANKDSE